MTREEREDVIQYLENLRLIQSDNFMKDGISKAIEALKQELILDKPHIKGDYYDGFKNGLRTAEWRYSKIKAEIRDWQTDIHDNEYDAEKYDFVFEPIYEIIDKYRNEVEKNEN